NEPETKQQSTVWIFKDELNQTKKISGKPPKVACFFGKTRYVTTGLFEHRRTVDSEWYTTIYLSKKNKRNKNSPSVHHNNSSSDTKLQILAFLTGKNDGSSPYSPDLEPMAFLFLHIKQNARPTICFDSNLF
ncbi:Uncharacterized protein FKW44_005210, partial [Caligus rogercresseyi]